MADLQQSAAAVEPTASSRSDGSASPCTRAQTAPWIRASYSADNKKGALVHELGHRMNLNLRTRPQDIDEKLLKPEPGEIVSKNDYELNQAVTFLKTRELVH